MVKISLRTVECETCLKAFLSAEDIISKKDIFGGPEKCTIIT